MEVLLIGGPFDGEQMRVTVNTDGVPSQQLLRQKIPSISCGLHATHPRHLEVEDFWYKLMPLGGCSDRRFYLYVISGMDADEVITRLIANYRPEAK